MRDLLTSLVKSGMLLERCITLKREVLAETPVDFHPQVHEHFGNLALDILLDVQTTYLLLEANFVLKE